MNPFLKYNSMHFKCNPNQTPGPGSQGRVTRNVQASVLGLFPPGAVLDTHIQGCLFGKLLLLICALTVICNNKVTKIQLLSKLVE